jgi:predicted esterase
MMLHGWSGDEKVMWVLETTVPSGSTIVTLRAPLEIAGGGYQWLASRDALDSEMDDYRSAVDALVLTVNDLSSRFGIDPASWIFMGFSQGAATALAYATMASSPSSTLGAMSTGFKPPGWMCPSVKQKWGTKLGLNAPAV